MIQRAEWQEISRLRVSIETKSLPSYRHAAPLEMTQGLEALLSEKSHRKKECEIISEIHILFLIVIIFQYCNFKTKINVSITTKVCFFELVLTYIIVKETDNFEFKF